MEYRKTKSGFEKLKQRNVDFGGGLERIAAALQDDPDVFKIDLFEGMRHELEVISRKPYGVNAEETYAYRVILDHIRAATFLIADGVPPANKDQGYFTRRLMRRSIRFAQKLGITQNFCAKVSEQVIEKYKDAYPELVKHRELIASIMNEEEQKFARTIRGGLQLFNELLKGRERKIIGGKEAFDLYQSYGFPLEMTEELATEHGFSVDRTGFEQELKVHQDVSRMGSEKKFKGGLADHSDMSVKYHTATHLLHAALRKVLGPQAEQRGSNITPERLRFDFAHPTKMTPEEIKATEDLVNAAIQRDYPMTWQELPLAEAKRLQAIGLFEEKYGDKVKVYTVGDPAGMPVADPSAKTFSREFCGGHVEHTGVIGKFKIVKEEACSAGVRRIKRLLFDLI